jgi:hypothetical protein
MNIRLPNDPEIAETVRRYVVWDTDQPRYSTLVVVHPLGDDAPDNAVFQNALAEDARHISDDDLGKLLSTEWRSRLTAAWLIGLDRRTQYRQTLSDLLLASEFIFAGQGYCFALTRFGQPEDADILTAYMTTSS